MIKKKDFLIEKISFWKYAAIKRHEVITKEGNKTVDFHTTSDETSETNLISHDSGKMYQINSNILFFVFKWFIFSYYYFVF